MDRREFLGSLAAGTVVAASEVRLPAFTTPPSARTIIHFVGMIGFVKRSDGSLLAATPGTSSLSHVPHATFVMAPSGSRAASTFGLQRHPGVVPGAFDPRLANANADQFAFGCLGNAAFDVQTGGDVAVDNRAPQLAQMQRIARGKRLRFDLMKWATTTIALQGGRLVSESIHPNADRIWQFGEVHRQALTDAVRYEATDARVRMSDGLEVRTVTPTVDEPLEFWVVVTGSGTARTGNDPRRLTHGAVLFDYLVGATPVIPECPEAVAGAWRATELPCGAPLVASLSPTVAVPTPFPLEPEWCFGGYFELA